MIKISETSLEEIREINQNLEKNIQSKDEIIESQNKFLLRLKSKIEKYKTENALLKRSVS